jgi:hypothetical protein
MVREIFLMFDNLQMHTGRRELEGSWTHPRSEDHYDVKDLAQCIGAGAPALRGLSPTTGRFGRGQWTAQRIVISDR